MAATNDSRHIGSVTVGEWQTVMAGIGGQRSVTITMLPLPH